VPLLLFHLYPNSFDWTSLPGVGASTVTSEALAFLPKGMTTRGLSGATWVEFFQGLLNYRSGALNNFADGDFVATASERTLIWPIVGEWSVWQMRVGKAKGAVGFCGGAVETENQMNTKDTNHHEGFLLLSGFLRVTSFPLCLTFLIL